MPSFVLSGRLKWLKCFECGFLGSQLSKICIYYNAAINRGVWPMLFNALALVARDESECHKILFLMCNLNIVSAWSYRPNRNENTHWIYFAKPKSSSANIAPIISKLSNNNSKIAMKLYSVNTRSIQLFTNISFSNLSSCKVSWCHTVKPTFWYNTNT